VLKDKLTAVLNKEELSRCMRCGFCQPACPTFRETGYEAASPRGRIALMKATAEGVMEPDQDFIDQMNLCLGCRACEPVCPAGVQYGQLIEQTREAIRDHVRHPWWVELLRLLAFHHLLPRQNRLYAAGRLLRFYQRSGLQRTVRKWGLLRWLPIQLREMEAVLPEACSRGLIRAVGPVVPPAGERKRRVGMFRGCIMDVLFHQTNVNTVRLLADAGCEVVIPAEQACCGALHAHSGERERARELAKRNVEAFRRAEVDVIVSNAGGCGALLQEYDQLLRGDPQWEADAAWFAQRVRDISEVLADLVPMQQWKPLDKRISYQSSCHLGNGMNVTRQPIALIQSIPDVTFVPLFEADRCCGSAGIYNLVQPEMSGRILDEKMTHVTMTNADILVTSNPGCLLQMKAGVLRAGLADSMQVMHLVDLLAACSPSREPSS